MLDKNSQLNIQISDRLNVENNYFDYRLFIDLGKDAIRHKKDYVLPIELECFLPYSFDLLSNVKQDEEDINKILGINDKVKDAEARKKEEFLKNTITIGNSKGINVYPSVAKTLKSSGLNSFKDRKELKRKTYEEKDDIFLYPLKLMLAVINYDQIAVDDPDEREIMDLLLDKITVAALLPYIASDEFWGSLIFKKDDDSLYSYEEVKAQMITMLTGDKNPIKDFLHMEMMKEEYAIKLNRLQYWNSLITYTLDRADGHAKILFPIDLLDEILTDHLQNVFSNFKTDKAGDHQIIKGIDNFKQRLPDGVRNDYGFFYPVVDGFLKNQKLRSGIQLLKQKYSSSKMMEEFSNQLPFVEEIDLRPIQWAKEAMQVTTEMIIAARKYEWAKKPFEKLTKNTDSSTTDFSIIEQLSNEFRNASSEWFTAKSRYEHLKNIVGKEGIDLTLKEQKLTDEIKIDHFFTLTRKRVESKNVILQKSRLEKWTETYTVRRLKRSFGFFRFYNEYRTREVSAWRTWYETEIQYYNVDQKIDIDYDPIGSYLDMDINIKALGKEVDIEKARTLGKSLRLSEDQISIDSSSKLDRIEYTGLRNRNKEVHIFNYIDGEFWDQNGIPLKSLLRELETHTNENDGILNQKKLFIIPQFSKSVSGEIVIDKYLAVHNPVAGRRTNIAPNIYIVETYKHAIEQVPGHWLGKLSHTTCLFPGETRKIKMTTSSRFESSMSNNSSTKQTSGMRQKEDVRSQVRNELEKENKSSQSNNWSANASAKAKWGSGSASASVSAGGSKTSSNSNIAKSLNDKVSEVLNDISSNNEVQFVTTTTSNFSENTSSESEIEIVNVNKGRSVNYKFFQILHKYVSKVVLDELKIVVEYNHEIIPGLDVVQTSVHGLVDLDTILPELIEEERNAVKEQLLNFIKNRYKDSLVSSDNKDDIEIDRNKAIAEEETYVNSGAFYLDNEVSIMPATEDYVEQVRAAELDKYKAETQKILAESTAVTNGKIIFPKEINNMNLYGWQLDVKNQGGNGLHNNIEDEVADQ